MSLETPLDKVEPYALFKYSLLRKSLRPTNLDFCVLTVQRAATGATSILRGPDEKSEC